MPATTAAPDLAELFARYGSDKEGSNGHSYASTYQRLLEPMRESVRDVLELGVLGGASLRAWRDFFPHARIIGLDNNPELVQWSAVRITVAGADVTDGAQLNAVLGDRMFDLIVDDASHWDTDQIKSWELLWHRVRPGGVYVVEDIAWRSQQYRLEGLGAEIIDLTDQRPRFDNVLAVFRKEVC